MVYFLWYGLVWYSLIWSSIVLYGFAWFGGGGDMFGNVLVYSRIFQETPKSFMGGGGIFAIIVSTLVQIS